MSMVQGEWRYRSIHFEPLYQLKLSGQHLAPATILLGKEPSVPIDQKAGWVQNCLDTLQKRIIFCLHMDCL